MKRTITLLLAVLVLLSLAACGAPAGGSEPEGSASNSKEVAQESAAPGTEVAADDDQNALQHAFKEQIGDSNVLFYKNVRNDVTGNWRVAVIYTSADIVENALDYYKAYFGSDDEIHFVCNLGLKTTTSIKVLAGQLYVDVYEYVDGEEHDAKTLPGGDLLKSYTVDMTTGEATELAE